MGSEAIGNRRECSEGALNGSLLPIDELRRRDDLLGIILPDTNAKAKAIVTGGLIPPCRLDDPLGHADDRRYAPLLF